MGNNIIKEKSKMSETVQKLIREPLETT